MSIKALFRWHLWLGLTTGLCLFIVGLTGSLAVFAPEIDWLIIKPLRVTAPTDSNATRVDVETMLAKLRAAYPDARVGSLALAVRPSFAHVAALQIPKQGDTPDVSGASGVSQDDLSTQEGRLRAANRIAARHGP